MRRPAATQLPVLLWTLAAWAAVRSQLLARRPWQQVWVPLPPSAARSDTWIVSGLLRRLRAACLPRSLVLQRWLGACGEGRDVVVGVTNCPTFRAHAWLDGSRDGQGFHELSRRAAPAPPPGGARPPADG